MHKAVKFNRLPETREVVDLLAADTAPPHLSTDRPLWLYGRGNLGRLAQDFFDAVHVRVDGIFERDEPAPPEARVAVCVVAEPYVPIERALMARGFNHVTPFYDVAYQVRGMHPLANGWYADELDGGEVIEVLDGWSDDASRKHYLQFLAWRRLREEWTFGGTTVTNQDRYFIPEVAAVLHDHEVFIDGGAHHGEVSRTFIVTVWGKFRRAVAVEADPANHHVLSGSLRWPGFETAEYALSDHRGIAKFAPFAGYASRLSETGSVLVATRTIADLNVEPTFIKLHLEGGELAALRGAEQLLVSCRPIIAATVYHNDDGVYRTAAWLMEKLENYRFLFRNHVWCGAGAVIYAIPGERSL